MMQEYRDRRSCLHYALLATCSATRLPAYQPRIEQGRAGRSEWEHAGMKGVRTS